MQGTKAGSENCVLGSCHNFRATLAYSHIIRSTQGLKCILYQAISLQKINLGPEGAPQHHFSDHRLVI